MFILIALAALTAFADDTFNRLIQSKKFSRSRGVRRQENPSESRTVDVWIKLGKANEEMGLPEKALASYLVGSRIDVKTTRPSAASLGSTMPWGGPTMH